MSKMLDHNCRWEEEAEEVLQPVEVIYYRGEADYQGSAQVMVRRADNSIAILDWSWGSCSHCDQWEAQDGYDQDGNYDNGGHKAALEDMTKSVQVMSAETALAYVQGLVRAFTEDKYYSEQGEEALGSYITNLMGPKFAEPIIARLMELDIRAGERNRQVDANLAKAYRIMKEEE